MTLIEAIKSGNKFKRPGQGDWCAVDALGGVVHVTSRDYLRFSAESLIADDWEIEEETIQITRSELARAWGAASHPSAQQSSMNPFFKQVARELGFKEEGTTGE